MSFPLRYAKGNVLLGRGGEAAGLYRLAMTSYPYLPTGEKWSLQRRLQRLAHTIGADFSLWRVQRAYPAERYVQHTAGLLDERHQQPAAWEAFLAGHGSGCMSSASHIPEVYLAVSLAGGAPAGVGSGLVRGVDRVRRRVEELAGIGAASPISGRRALRTRHARAARVRAAERRACRAAREDRRASMAAAPRRLPGSLRARPGQALAAGRADRRRGRWRRRRFSRSGMTLARCANAAITEHQQTLVVDGEQGPLLSGDACAGRARRRAGVPRRDRRGAVRSAGGGRVPRRRRGTRTVAREPAGACAGA